MDTLDWDAMPIVSNASSSFDPIDMISSWKICHRQEAATRLVADAVAAKSATGPRWEYCTKVGSPFSPTHNKVSKFSNYPLAFCGLMPDFGSNTLISNKVTGPLGSLDCLLSANNTTSNTDTPVKKDGISMIFSDDSKRLWNNINTDNAVSTGESVIHSPVKKLDETLSQSSSYSPHEIPMRSTEAKRNMTKRSHDQDLQETDCSTGDSGFRLISENQPKSKKLKSYNKCPSSSNINFQQASSSASSLDEPDSEAIAQMKEMIYRAAAFKPVTFSTEEVQKPKRKNVRISTDPQTVAARQRRERISEKIKILQKMVPGGNKMDTASMLDEAANYLKFLRTQVKELEAFGYKIDPLITNFSPLTSIQFNNYPFPMQLNCPLNSIHRPMS